MPAAAPRPPARQPLAARWTLAAADPGRPEAPPDGWLATAAAQPVAVALRDAGQWRLDDPPRDFDAQDWWYRAEFDVAPGTPPQVLGFDGLATLAQGWLNGQPLLASDNMHLAHRVPAGALRPGANELLLRFDAVATALGRRRSRPRWRTPMVAHQQLRWIRTTLLGRTPGWSPPAAVVGPWRPVWACNADEAAWDWRLQPHLDTDHHGHCTLQLQAPAGWSRDVEQATFVLRAADGREHAAPLQSAAGGWTARVAIDRPRPWWPHTHGEPHLYDALLRTQRRDGTRDDLPLGRVGLRRIEVDRSGGGFALRVNGESVFCRGAGWLPLDPVTLRSDGDALHATLARVRDAGMNMLRVAGTGVYEDDAFYDACDAAGVLVWQEFMYASMDYPLDDAGFAASATLEARQQLARLARHACLAVLCGNSEVEQQAAMWGAPRELWQPAFFHATLPALCSELAPGVPYWPSSAHGGAFPHQADAGTTSYYGVGAYEQPLDDARRSGLRFATECLAFATVPDTAALQRVPGGLATRVHHPAWKARSPRDLGAGWDFDDVRDHYVRTLCDVEPARLRHADHDRYLALGRLAVGEAMGQAYAQWRQQGSVCGGALLLQLRDLWAGAGWGVLDDAGAPKSAWHALRRALQPLALSIADERSNGLWLHVANETACERTLVLVLAAWRDGSSCVARGEHTLRIAPRSALRVSAVDLLGQLLDLGHYWRFGPPACELVHAQLLEDGAVAAEAFHFPSGLGPLLARRDAAGLVAQATVLDDDHAQLHVGAQGWALGVQLDLPGWTADDDHFHLAPGAQRRIALRRAGAGALVDGQVLALNAPSAVPVTLS